MSVVLSVAFTPSGVVVWEDVDGNEQGETELSVFKEVNDLGKFDEEFNIDDNSDFDQQCDFTAHDINSYSMFLVPPRIAVARGVVKGGLGGRSAPPII